MGERARRMRPRLLAACVPMRPRPRSSCRPHAAAGTRGATCTTWLRALPRRGQSWRRAARTMSRPAPCLLRAHRHCGRYDRACFACGRPALRRLPPSRRRAAQAIALWYTADGAEALGGAAPTAVLAQYHSGLCAVLAWLNGAAPPPPPPSSRSPPEFALLAEQRRTIKEAACKVRAPPLTCSPCAERAADHGLGRRSTCSRRRCCTAARPPTRTPRTWKRTATPPAATC